MIHQISSLAQSIQFKANYYSVKDGLPGREIFDAVQDSRGFIWISSYKRLTRFDGYHFIDFSHLTTQTIGEQKRHSFAGEKTTFQPVSNKYILLKSESKNPQLDIVNTSDLIVKSYNLAILLKGKYVLDYLASYSTQSIIVFCLDQADLILYRFNPESEKIEKIVDYSLKNNLSEWPIDVQIAVNQFTGQVYFKAATTPLYVFDLKENTAKEIKIPKSVKGYKKIKPLRMDELAILENDQSNLLIVNLHNQNMRIVKDPLLGQRIDDMWTDLEGNIILAKIVNRVFKNLCLITNNTNEVTPLDFLLETEELISEFSGIHFLDKILLSTYTGFYTLTNEKKRFKSLLTKNVKNGNFGIVIRSMIEDDRGSLYINEEKNKIYKLNMNVDTIEKIFRNSPYPDVAINGSLKKIGNELWGVCAKTPQIDQLFSFNLETEKFTYWPLPFQNFAIKSMAVVDSYQLMCFGRDFTVNIDTPAVHIFNTYTHKWKHLHLISELSPFRYQYSLKESENSIWVGTSKGLYLLNTELKRMEKIDFGPIENPQIDISVHTFIIHPTTKYLLIGTEYGVWIYDPLQKKHIDHFTTESIGLCNDNIEGIIIKNDDEIFVTTDNGLSLVHIKARLARNYYENDGLAHNEFNVLAAHKGSNGRYYFGGTNGITIISDSSLSENNYKNPVISRFYKFDSKSGNEFSIYRDLQNTNTLFIEPNVQYFGFDLMYPDYTEPRLNQFQTWLEGYENDWQRPMVNNKIRYGRLPKGDYTFHVRSFPNIKNEIKVNVEVKEHFYKAPWFSSAIAILVIGGSLVVYVRYQQRKRNKELEIQKTNQKFKDLETAALRAQMNPHFIFNCLGSIQQFINEHDTESASKYLANFARLVRLALHSSVDGKHSLQDEIYMLDDYLGLERLRFGEKFTYDINVDPALDKEDIYLPPLLIQPFVENALLHGMKNKTEGGKIVVSFNQHEKGIDASVTDNGPGISTEKRSMDSSGHKSIGMTLTKKRLEILSNNDAFKISSILDKDGTLGGTKVSIVIPIL